jgi:hypothetical protein
MLENLIRKEQESEDIGGITLNAFSEYSCASEETKNQRISNIAAFFNHYGIEARNLIIILETVLQSEKLVHKIADRTFNAQLFKIFKNLEFLDCIFECLISKNTELLIDKNRDLVVEFYKQVGLSGN